MRGERQDRLRALRGDMSVRAFTEYLVQHGLTAKLSRHRLGAAERGEVDLPAALWDEIAATLIRAGHTVADVAALRPFTAPIEPVPIDPAVRLAQWRRLVGHVRDNKWWRTPTALLARVANPELLPGYREVIERYGVDRMRYLRAVRARLAADGRWVPDPADRVAVDRASSVLRFELGRGELFVFRLHLHNVGSVAWRDRLLYRIGPPVTSTMPFTPGILPVPDTKPGESCEILVPGRAQWLCGLAAVNFAMVFPDFTSCLAGRLCCWTDTRSAGVDHSQPLPPGFPADGRP
jgi:hypothetical protein